MLSALSLLRITPAVTSVLWIAVVGGGIAGVLWIVHELRDGARAEVRAEYAEAARRKNIEIGNLNSADDAVAAVVEAALRSKTEAAAGVNGPACPATKDQARALTAIRRLR